MQGPVALLEKFVEQHAATGYSGTLADFRKAVVQTEEGRSYLQWRREKNSALHYSARDSRDTNILAAASFMKLVKKGKLTLCGKKYTVVKCS